MLEIIAELLRDGKDLKQIVAELSLHLRSLMIYQAAGTVANMDLYAEQDEVLKEQAKLFATEQIMHMIKRLHEAMNEMKWSPQPRITVEVALLALCRPEAAAVSPAAMPAAAADDSRIAQLEAKLAQVTAALAKRPASPAAAAPTTAAARPVARPMQVQAAPPPEPLEVTAADAEVWDTLLKRLREANKMPILACVQQGSFAGMTEKQFFIQFKGSLMASLTMRNYRQQLEALLQEITGRELHLSCSGEDRPMVPPPRPKAQPRAEAIPLPEEPPAIPVDLNDIPPEERAPLETAFNYFGDHVVEIEDDK